MLADSPKNVLDVQYRILAETGRVGSARFKQTVDTGVIPVSSDANPGPLNWDADGYVIAMYGQTVSDAPSCSALDYALTRFRLQFGGTEDLITDGRGAPDFGPMLGFVGGVSNWMPLMRRVRRGDLWVVTFRNAGTVNGQSPKMTFAWLTDADIAKLQAAAAGR